MKPIPEIVKKHVMENCGRMPETDEEVNQYLDLINHLKEYVNAFEFEEVIGKRFMKKIGMKTTDEIKKEGQEAFKPQ